MIVRDGVDANVERLLGSVQGLDQLLEALLRGEEDWVHKDSRLVDVVIVIIVVVMWRRNRRGNGVIVVVVDVGLVSLSVVSRSVEQCLEPSDLKHTRWAKFNNGSDPGSGSERTCRYYIFSLFDNLPRPCHDQQHRQHGQH
jgi:hypothetical protein